MVCSPCADCPHNFVGILRTWPVFAIHGGANKLQTKRGCQLTVDEAYRRKWRWVGRLGWLSVAKANACAGFLLEVVPPEIVPECKSHSFTRPSVDLQHQSTNLTSCHTPNYLSFFRFGDKYIEVETPPELHRHTFCSRANDSLAYNHQHNPQCLTQHSPRRAYRPSSFAVLESRSTPSHLRPRICPKRSSPSRTVPWSGTLWTGAIAWELLVCLT